jgi:hypothetical protein
LEAPFARFLERLCAHNGFHELLLKAFVNYLVHSGDRAWHTSIGLSPPIHHIREHAEICIDEVVRAKLAKNPGSSKESVGDFMSSSAARSRKMS